MDKGTRLPKWSVPLFHRLNRHPNLLCKWVRPLPFIRQGAAHPNLGGGEKVVHFGGKKWTGSVVTLCGGQLKLWP
jgi:hypothetical protein